MLSLVWDICEMQGFTYINNSLKQKLSSHKWMNYFLNQKSIELPNLVLDTVTVVISKHNSVFKQFSWNVCTMEGLEYP